MSEDTLKTYRMTYSAIVLYKEHLKGKADIFVAQIITL